MPFENFFNHRCSIYHLEKYEYSPGAGLRPQIKYEYQDEPHLSGVPCHFTVNTNTEMLQQSPMNTYLYTGKLALPQDTDIRVNCHDSAKGQHIGALMVAALRPSPAPDWAATQGLFFRREQATESSIFP